MPCIINIRYYYRYTHDILALSEMQEGMTNIKNAYLKYFAALLIFGMNGIVASKIALSSYEIVLTRTLIGSLLLLAVFALSRQKVHLFLNKTA